jgi:anthranilate phosphoribosyltransferase
MAGALGELGLEHGFVVHGSDGLDEITTTGPTLAFEVRAGSVERRVFEPEDFGVAAARHVDLEGGDVLENREIAVAILAGETGPKRDIVLVNASAALVAAGLTADFREGVEIAGRSIDSGAARKKLAELVRFTNRVRALSPE